MTNMIRQQRRLKVTDKGGFSLIETLVALAIFAIMALIVTTLFMGAMRQQALTVKTDNELNHQIADAETKNISGTDLSLRYKFSGIESIEVSATIGEAGDSSHEQQLDIIIIP